MIKKTVLILFYILIFSFICSADQKDEEIYQKAVERIAGDQDNVGQDDNQRDNNQRFDKYAKDPRHQADQSKGDPPDSPSAYYGPIFRRHNRLKPGIDRLNCRAVRSLSLLYFRASRATSSCHRHRKGCSRSRLRPPKPW